MSDMRRDFASREDLIAYLSAEFPEAVAVDDSVAPTQGGRKAGERALDAIKPKQYAATRNRLNGAVTRLSMYIRHGVLGLAEVRDMALEKAATRGDVEKLINELAWRDYWQRLYYEMGDGIWQDREPYKTGYKASDYANTLPDDVRDGETGLACMDGFTQELRETGYLHNHARMWMAAYLIHWRRVSWQAGASWFLQHLLDGDPASNNLSWQWVASTVSFKPYFFNRENLERNTDGRYCRECPLRAKCPLEGSYDRLGEKLFPKLPSKTREEW